MKFNALIFTLVSTMAISCNSSNEAPKETKESPSFQNEGHRLVYEMVQKVGNYSKLLEKNDVVYTYTYTTPDGKKDVSTEKYIFDGELSYGAYDRHERTFSELEGPIEQGYDGTEFWLKHYGVLVEEDEYMKKLVFNRKTNFYWFTMNQKLLDPGLNYEYLKEEEIENQLYDVVKITFNSSDGKPTDIYQLYINKKTLLLDQFLFTVADFGKVDVPNLMKVEYEEIDGMFIPTNRKYKKSTWNADVSEDPWIVVTWSNIKFNNNMSKSIFNKQASLKAILDEKKSSFELKADDEKKRAYKEGIESVEQSGILSSAKQVGDTAPNFILNNALGKPVTLKDYLKKGKVILTWYRGGWCPYCNLTLHHLQQELPNFRANGANLITLTPELPDKSISTAEKHNLGFEVLSDVGNVIAKEYGIVFKLTDEVANYYNNSFDMNSYNGDQSNELPLAATYIIDEQGVIIYAFLDADYRNRAEPSELTEFIKSH